MWTATKLGVNRMTMTAWLGGRERPQRCMLARLAGFLRRVGYLLGAGGNRDLPHLDRHRQLDRWWSAQRRNSSCRPELFNEEEVRKFLVLRVFAKIRLNTVVAHNKPSTSRFRPDEDRW